MQAAADSRAPKTAVGPTDVIAEDCSLLLGNFSEAAGGEKEEAYDGRHVTRPQFKEASGAGNAPQAGLLAATSSLPLNPTTSTSSRPGPLSNDQPHAFAADNGNLPTAGTPLLHFTPRAEDLLLKYEMQTDAGPPQLGLSSGPLAGAHPASGSFECLQATAAAASRTTSAREQRDGLWPYTEDASVPPNTAAASSRSMQKQRDQALARPDHWCKGLAKQHGSRQLPTSGYASVLEADKCMQQASAPCISQAAHADSAVTVEPYRLKPQPSTVAVKLAPCLTMAQLLRGGSQQQQQQGSDVISGTAAVRQQQHGPAAIQQRMVLQGWEAIGDPAEQTIAASATAGSGKALASSSDKQGHATHSPLQAHEFSGNTQKGDGLAKPPLQQQAEERTWNHVSSHNRVIHQSSDMLRVRQLQSPADKPATQAAGFEQQIRISRFRSTQLKPERELSYADQQAVNPARTVTKRFKAAAGTGKLQEGAETAASTAWQKASGSVEAAVPDRMLLAVEAAATPIPSATSEEQSRGGAGVAPMSEPSAASSGARAASSVVENSVMTSEERQFGAKEAIHNTTKPSEGMLHSFSH